MRSLFLILLLSFIPAAAADQRDFSVANTGWNGTSKLYKVAEEAGYNLETEPIDFLLSDSLAYQKKKALVILRPTEDISSEALHAFVSGGGRVLFAEDFKAGSEALKKFGIGIGNSRISSSRNFQNESCCPIAIPAEGFQSDDTYRMINAGVKEIVTNYPSYIYFRANVELTGVPVLSFPSGAFVDANYNGVRDGDEQSVSGLRAAYAFYVGKGRLVVVSDPSIFINEMLELGDNKRLYKNILKWLAESEYTVVFESGESLEIPSDAANPWNEAWSEHAPVSLGAELDLGAAVYMHDPFSIVFTATPAFLPTAPYSDYHQYWRVDAYDYYTGNKWIKTDSTMTTATASPESAVRITFQKPFASSFVPVPVALYPVKSAISSITRTGYANALPYATSYDSIFVKTSAIYREGDFQYRAAFASEQIDPLKIGSVEDIPENLVKYTQLPPSVPDSVDALAQSLKTPGANVLEQAQIAADYLKQNFEYDADMANGKLIEDPPASNQEITEWFLGRKKGICTHFATMHVVLLRELGIPARVAVGYAPGVVDGNVRKVMNGHAHAWSEVYVPGYGWVSMDATGSTDDAINLPPNSGAVIAKIEKHLEASRAKLGESKDSFYSGNYQEAYEKARAGVKSLERAENLTYDSSTGAEKLIGRLEKEISYLQSDVKLGENATELEELMNAVQKSLEESKLELESNNVEGAVSKALEGLSRAEEINEKLYGVDSKKKAENAIRILEDGLRDLQGGASQELTGDKKTIANISIVDLSSILPLLLLILAALSLGLGTKYELTVLSLFRKELKPTSEFKKWVAISIERGEYSDAARILGEKFLKALEGRFRVEIPAEPKRMGRVQKIEERIYRSLGLYLDPYKAKLSEEIAREYPSIERKRIYKLIRRFDRIAREEAAVGEKEMESLYRSASEILSVIGADLYERERKF